LFLFFLFALTCSAQYRFREIKCKQDKDLVFPVFISDNKTAAKRVNDFLQMEFFETTTSQTPEAKLFDKDRFISNDTLSQTGYTSISYRIELNNPKLFSVIFEVEAMGAYPTYYQRYFNFNSRNGAVISTDSFFTPEGIVFIRNVLIEKRREVIRKSIEELKADDSSRFLEDSTFIFETFESCNEESEEKNMFIEKEKILFYKYNCFPHAWGPYETDLDLEFSYKELEKYLSDFGKRILFTK